MCKYLVQKFITVCIGIYYIIHTFIYYYSNTYYRYLLEFGRVSYLLNIDMNNILKCAFTQLYI